MGERLLVIVNMHLVNLPSEPTLDPGVLWNFMKHSTSTTMMI